MVKLIARKRTLSVHYLEFFSSIQGGILQSLAQKIDALRCHCIYRKLQDNLFTRWLVALTYHLHSSNSWRLFLPVGPVKSNQLRWCSGRKNSSPIQRQGRRKNYPWVSLEVFNGFSSSRWKGVWEMPAHRAGSSPGHGKESFGSFPPRSQLQGSSPSLPSRRFLARPCSPGRFWGWEFADTGTEALLQV